MSARRPTGRRRKRLGQHFLTDARVLERQIAYAELVPDDVVLEIGPGLGALTRRLAPLVKRVVAVELDPAMVAELERRGLAEGNVSVVQADATKLDLTTIPFTKVVANLPYSASTPITFRLFEASFRSAVLMYQLEFAQRMVAKPGGDDYGRLAAACAYFAVCEIVETVPPTAFTPPPEVRSALVRLRPHARPPFSVSSPRSYSELLRIAFSTRRKTLRSTLRRHHPELGLAAWAPVEAALAQGGWSDRRPEEMSPAQLGALDVALGKVRDARA